MRARTGKRGLTPFWPVAPRKRGLTPFFGALGLALIFAAIGVRAAPMVPAQAALPEEARSLAGLSGVRVEVNPVLDAPADHAFDADALRRRLVELLERGGLEVKDDERLPRLVMKVVVARHGDLPDGLAIACVIAVHQRVHVERLEASMTLPTASISAVELATRSRAREALDHALRSTAESLATVIRQASQPGQGR